MQRFQYIRHEQPELLTEFLSRRFAYLNAQGWIENIQNQAILVNDRPVEIDYLLQTNDVISYTRPRSAEPEIDPTYRILYLDEAIVVVEKSGNIPIAESGRYHYNTLVQLLHEKENLGPLYPVHRLDRETSGVLVIARSKEIATRMGKQFLDRIPRKRYHAILQGMLPAEKILITTPLRKAPQDGSTVRVRQIAGSGGKHAKTLFTRKASLHGLTLVEIELFTGRTHQIRCHAERIGFPVLGDKLYGKSDEEFVAIMKGRLSPIFEPWGIINRQLLHASYLEFIHPKTGRIHFYHSDYDAEFQRFEFLQELLALKDGAT